MNNRRTFLKQAGIGMAAAYLSPSLLASCAPQRKSTATLTEIGLQLYTLRDQVATNAVATIARVAEIGYNHVETFDALIGDDGKVTFWGLDAQTLSSHLSDHHLKTYSGHYDLGAFLTPGDGNQDALKAYIDTAATLGQHYLIAPVPPILLIDTLTPDNYRFMADQLNSGGELAARSGLKIGYHNHFWEFRTLADGSRGMDILLENTDKELVAFELDLFWSEKSETDSAAYFEKYPGRFPLWHIKDMDQHHSETIIGGDYDTKPFMEIVDSITYAEVGTGSIDFKHIMDEAKTAGLQYAFVEQDVIMIPPFESIAQSYRYVKNELLESSETP
ncbi:sugar phosphate isomerase/epimerase family protein [Parapedobacter sp. 10938]|uniref:sugar phosphate isomerase/epimerase family protein n=1 Tax=Parapedobacter flavus TaxID=3110225 RepID=UPI002DBF52F1|nr:sugar phosphate isomerase/epimerase [Parapedobacter sp. 10938]MEC3878298.1 sugar phosphate isomerase/epimerase [Parapedobacter sp. 10938]